MRANIVTLTILVCSIFQLTNGRVTEFRLSPYEEVADSRIYHEVRLIGEPDSELQTNSISNDGDYHDNKPTPVVFWHGMGDTAYGSCDTDRKALEKKYPGLTVLSIQIGNNSAEDAMASYFSNVNHQIDLACKAVLNSPTINQHKSFNAIGFSQGGQFLRGLIQRCPFREHGIMPKNLISLGGQQQGVFGLPNCESFSFCDHLRFILTHAAYEHQVQEHVVQAEYWHDPLREKMYKEKNIFLADINNENEINETYKQNLLSLDNLVLVQFLQDEMVIPRESSLFGYYEAGSTKTIVPLEQSALYLEDRLGLRQLATSGRLHQVKIPGRHLQYRMSWFLNNIASIYLNN